MERRMITEDKIKEYQNYLIKEEKSENTIKKYIRDIRAFAGYVLNAGVTKMTVISYKESLSQSNYSVRSINSMLSSVNSFLKFSGWNDCQVKMLRIHNRKVYCKVTDKYGNTVKSNVVTLKKINKN